MTEYRCVHGHDKCNEMYPGSDCPYCERVPGAQHESEAARKAEAWAEGWLEKLPKYDMPLPDLLIAFAAEARRAALPAEPAPEVIEAMLRSVQYRNKTISYYEIREAYRALRAAVLGEEK